MLTFGAARVWLALSWVGDAAAEGGEDRSRRPSGKIVLTRGLRHLVAYLALTLLLTEERRRHGLPSPIFMFGGTEHGEDRSG